jgi:TolB-like protein/thioredoxin-like negative regulator of GroEL
VARLLREAQAAASVEHPAVVTVYEAGLADDQPYLVMQRVEGETLEERLERGRLPIPEALALTGRVADALAEVHALGIVHRDLKPSNIILSARGPKILDFGVASVKGSPRLTASGTPVGTPLTMSPEQVKGLPADNRSDLWALGVILYEALTGKAPFEGETPVLVAHAVLTIQPPPPSSLRPEVGAELDYIVMKLLRKDAAHRYARAEELLADLASCDAASAGRGAAAKPAIPRVAVLYFEVLSSDPGDAFLAAGLTDDLIVDLTRLQNVQVASREDVRVYRDRPVPPRTLARELAVDFVLLGSVRRAGNRARIAAQLVRASDGHALWAERFDRTLDDLFEVQAEVSRRIVEALQVRLKPGEREVLERAPTRSTEAYALYLRARELLDGLSREGNLRAAELLKQATDLDPQFALAHAALGECYAARGLKDWDPDTGEQAMLCALRALEIDPDLFEGHIARAMALRLKGEAGELQRELEQLLRINPDHAQMVEWVAWTYLTLGQPERAVGILQRASERRPDDYRAVGYLAAAYEMLGRADDFHRVARQEIESAVEFVRHHPDDAMARAWLSVALLKEGQREAALQQVERALALSPDDCRVRYNAACAFARAGMADRAIAELKEAFRQTRLARAPGTSVSEVFADWPRRDPDLASLREHPEFIQLFGRAAGP